MAYKRWTEKEVRLLKLRAKRMTCKEIAESLGRPYTSVKQKAQQLQVKFLVRTAVGKKSGKQRVWTKKEDETLISLLKTKSLKEVSEVIDRSQRAIHRRLWHLDTKVSDIKLTNRAIGEMIGVSEDTVSKYKKRLGFDFLTLKNSRGPTDEELASLFECIIQNDRSTAKLSIANVKRLISKYGGDRVVLQA